MTDSLRSEAMRLGVTVRCQKQQPPPWQDLWEITADGVWLVQLSAELMSMPDPLPPRLHQLRELIEHVIARGLETDPRPAYWHHGSHPDTLAVDELPRWVRNKHGIRVIQRDDQEDPS